MPNDEGDSEHQGFQNYDASRTESVRGSARDVPTHHAVQLAGLYRPYPTVAVYGRVAPSSANDPKLEFVLADGTLVGRKTVSFLPSYSTTQKRKARASVLQQHADTEEPLTTTLPT
ncbi:hypothetical protein HII31_07320 [Pseudocercospora fuligena]|uniref:Uncharacterized protein n=1 Tax=Pseudocercospora fuligena TaxID=685502 RepID=A0A8H6RI85_9PEZI|nr:hypothetical protein HII31_07320 [Pseudocercospora fuligena]